MHHSGTTMFMVCESPLHAGTGSDLDFIDKPIQRERHTQFPKIESSSLKGALRERFAGMLDQGNAHPDMDRSFGPFDLTTSKERQGALIITDARLLLLPVKSMKGIFAWVTCPRVLHRLAEDLQKLPDAEPMPLQGLPSLGSEEALVFSEHLVINPTGAGQFVVLEEFDFKVADQPSLCRLGNRPLQDWLAEQIYPEDAHWQDMLRRQLIVLSDEAFADFAEFNTEVITRNKIDSDTGTVADGHLFSEEYLPADSVLYNQIFAHQEFKKEDPLPAADILSFFTSTLNQCQRTFQVGGNASIGKGLIKAQFFTQNS